MFFGVEKSINNLREIYPRLGMSGGGKTPRIVWMKEIVAAALGVLVVVSTLYLLLRSFTLSPPDLSLAQAVFSILGGWGGVVLGYYFGRLPAERRATRAESAAEEAEAAKDTSQKREQITLVENEGILSQVEEALETYKNQVKSLLEEINEL